MVLRNIEVYENNPDTFIGIVKFFNAYTIVRIFMEIFHKKKFNPHEIDIVNMLLMQYRSEEDKNKKHKMFVYIKKIIDNKYKSIHDFLELKEIKSSNYVPVFEFEIDRRHVSGCVGTVVEM